jgi:hypothetical protein
MFNMKPARPSMLANLKIIWQFHTHPVHQKVSRYFGPRYIGNDFFRAESSLIQSRCRCFIRVIVPYEISKVNFRVETKILVSMSEEI